ncbi:hypothetical protein [Kitasatospora sp. NBC_01302]|uniref:hypothetical protein n=1 Tax=Kitasatospora sp. NBC_01302 TaxID=2903575 RepID=UPI002E0D2ABC|nr:phosphotransferase [Kitasatospora sp. NBC_01302]
MFYPPDAATTQRMVVAWEHTQAATGGLITPGRGSLWGYEGRTLSGHATTDNGESVWLRLVGETTDRANGRLWEGPAAAQRQLSPGIPRPALRTITQWVEDDHTYRAEVYDLLTEQLVSASPVIETDPELPAEWWANLRSAIDTLGSADPLDRDACREVYIRRRVPEFTGVVPGEIQWTTAHGDLHWSNLCGPTLAILDWETWGKAPVGFDAAMLLVHSLLEPATASRVAEGFADVLDSDGGHLAQLIAVTQILQAADRTPFYTALAPAARKHLDVLTE